MTGFCNLPDETIDLIIAALLVEPLDVRVKIWVSLAQTCKRMYALLLPHLYRHVVLHDYPRSMEYFNAILKANPRLKNTMQTLIIQFGLATFSSSVPEDLSKTTSGKSEIGLVQEIREILYSLENLRTLKIELKMDSHLNFHSPRLPWTLDVTRFARLGCLWVDGFLQTPKTVNTFVSHPCLRTLTICDNFDENSWVPEAQTDKSFVVSLSIAPQNGAPLRVLRSFLPSFDHLTKLMIILGPDMLSGEAFLTLRDQLGEQSRLEFLSPKTPHLGNLMDYDLEFLEFSRLKELIIDSVLLWPYVNGFRSRTYFYNRLPPSLERLIINFPHTVDHAANDVDSDGIVQKNYPAAAEAWPRIANHYRNQHISSRRYVWIANLLKRRYSPEHDGERYLPMLNYIKLSEERFYPKGFSGLENSASCKLQLPQELADKFEARGVHLNLWARSYMESPLEVDGCTDDDRYGAEHTSNSPGEPPLPYNMDH